MSLRRLTVRRGPVSGRVDVRVLLTLAVLLVGTAVAFVLQVARGEFPLPPGEVISTLLGGGDEATRFIVVDLRLPRALVAVLAGAALGVAGAIFQDLARNPLVAPDIIGVTGGASLAVVVLVVLGDADGVLAVPLAGLGGAITAGVALYVLAWRGGVQGHRLVLVGIGLAAMFQAGVSWVLTRGQIYDVTEAFIWLVGSLNGRGWEHVWPVVVALVVLVPIALVLARRLDALQLGDDVARSLGVSVERARLGLVAVAVGLTGAAVAVAGPIAFVAFIAPHVARRLCGSVAPSSVLVVAAAVGGLLVVTADLAGRLAFAPTEIPVGIVTAVLAAPYFLLLLRRSGRVGEVG